MFREIGDMPYLAATFTSLAGLRRRGNADAARRDRAEASAILDALPYADAAQVRAWIAREAAAPPAAVLTPDPRSRLRTNEEIPNGCGPPPPVP